MTFFQIFFLMQESPEFDFSMHRVFPVIKLTWDLQGDVEQEVGKAEQSTWYMPRKYRQELVKSESILCRHFTII